MSRAKRTPAYEEGYDAFENGVDAENCPHGPETEQAGDWWAGYQKAMFEAEETVRGQMEDYRLDDPRHGQGTR